MDAYRYAAAIIFHGNGFILMQDDVYPVGIAISRLIYSVIHDFPEEMVQSARAGRADIHAGAHANRFKPFKNLYVF